MIDFKNVSKLLGGRDVFNDVSFRINKGERIGIVGPNGAGKTTLFSLICNDISPDKGEIVKPDKIRIGFLRQQLTFFKADEPLLSYVEAASGELPALHQRMEQLEAEIAVNATPAKLDELGSLQSAYEHLGGYDMKHRAEAALAGLGFRDEVYSKPMGEFSGGWQMRACMARVLLGEPDILLLDEPSNYLDIPAVEWLQRRLKNYDGTLLLISHDRFLLNSLTDLTLEINGGHVTRYPGNYTYYARERENRKLQSDAARKNTERRKQQLEDNINRFRAKATKAAQVQSWIKMLDKIEDVDLPEELHFHGSIRIPEPPRCGAEVVRLDHVSHSYDGGNHWIFRDVSLAVANGDKLGIVGYNGMGKTTLLKLIAGRMSPAEGDRRLGHKVIVGYQAQEFAELLPPEETAYQVVRNAACGNDAASQRVREILGSFGFSGDAALKECRVLSGGEKIRLCFARIFVNPPNLLILDEPTTHLDIAAREALQEAIRTYQGTVCLVSHDVEFLRGSVTSILEMRPDRVRRYPGNFDYYKEKIAEESQTEKAQASVATETEPDVSRKGQRREKAQKRIEMAPRKKRLEKEVAKLEKCIAEAEAEKKIIVAALSDPATPATEYPNKMKRLKNLDYDIAEAEMAWENAASALEEFMKEYDAI